MTRKEWYVLGILSAMGSLAKGYNTFAIQTIDENKLWALKYISFHYASNKQIKRRKRMLRGKEIDVFILNFANKDLANLRRRLNDDYYDNVDFMRALIELKHYSRNNVHYITSHFEVGEIIGKQVGLKVKKKPIYTNTEMVKIRDYYNTDTIYKYQSFWDSLKDLKGKEKKKDAMA